MVRSLRIDACFEGSPDRVWATVNDFARWPAWFLGVRRLRGTPQQAGGAAREITLVHRQTHRERIEA